MNLRKPLQFRPILFTLVLVLVPLVSPSSGQELPKKIRGYKVYKSEVRIGPDKSPDAGGRVVEVDFGEPVLQSIGPFGAAFLLPGSLVVHEGKGKIDLLAFEDFTVNGIPVEIGDYAVEIDLRAGERIELARPIEILLSIPSAVRAAAKEISGGENFWPVRGRVFVFGRFKRFGFTFKRVIPMDVEFTVRNPLRQPLAGT